MQNLQAYPGPQTLCEQQPQQQQQQMPLIPSYPQETKGVNMELVMPQQHQQPLPQPPIEIDNRGLSALADAAAHQSKRDSQNSSKFEFIWKAWRESTQTINPFTRLNLIYDGVMLFELWVDQTCGHRTTLHTNEHVDEDVIGSTRNCGILMKVNETAVYV